MVVLCRFYVSLILVNILVINILTQIHVGYLKICAKKYYASALIIRDFLAHYIF